MKFKKIFILFILINFSHSSYASQSVEEIIKGRKAMFSENYQNGKKISILLKSKLVIMTKYRQRQYPLSQHCYCLIP